MADARVERALYERAVGYTYDSEKLMIVDGEIRRLPIKEHVPPEFNSMRFWLANRQRKRWKDIAKIEHGVDAENSIAAWFKQFDGTAMRPQPRELPKPEPLDAEY